MSHEPIFTTKNGKPSCHQYLGKAGSDAYLKAIASLARRGKLEGIDRALNTVLMGLEDLLEEATRLKKSLMILKMKPKSKKSPKPLLIIPILLLLLLILPARIPSFLVLFFKPIFFKFRRQQPQQN
jgi:hypothetical protein